MSGTFSVATFLDPRFKTVFFLDKVAAEITKKKVIEMAVYEINKEWATVKSALTATPATAPTTSTDTGISRDTLIKPYDYINIWEDIDIQDVYTLESPLAIVIAKVQRYLDNRMLPRSKSPNLKSTIAY